MKRLTHAVAGYYLCCCSGQSLTGVWEKKGEEEREEGFDLSQ